MPDRARKKEKHQLKRKAKQRASRRASAVTPLQRIAAAGGAAELECYVNEGWEDQGMAMVYCLAAAPDGRHVMAAFLVDVWCVGLKDAFGEPSMTRADFDDVLDRFPPDGAPVRVSTAEAKRLVTGGVRFARQNGFHLPPRWDRWAAVFGNLGDVAHADLTGFGVEGGKLRYIGTRQFLQKRLRATTPEAFLQRPDVEWVMGDLTPRNFDDQDSAAWDDDEDDDGEAYDDDEYDEDDDDADLEQDATARAIADQLAGVQKTVEAGLRRWLFSTGRAPHPRLGEALSVLLVSMFPIAAASELDGVDPNELPDPNDLFDAALGDRSPADRKELDAATEQITEFMKQFPNPAEMFRVLGMNGD